MIIGSDLPSHAGVQCVTKTQAEPTSQTMVKVVS